MLNSQHEIKLIDKNVFEWGVKIKGLRDSELERVDFSLTLKFSNEYPNVAPKVKFATKMFHPNVDREGYVHAGFCTDEWQPTDKVQVLIGKIQQLLLEPDLNHCVN